MMRIRFAVHRPGHRRGRRLYRPLTGALLAGILSALAAPAAEAITGGSPVTNNDLAFVAEVRNTAASGLCTVR